MNDGAIMGEGITGCEGLVSEFAGKHDIVYISNSEGKMVVTIHHDGQVEFGPGYTPDEAAKEFWVALGHHAPKPDPLTDIVGPHGKRLTVSELADYSEVLPASARKSPRARSDSVPTQAHASLV